jgi:hypothetical protein
MSFSSHEVANRTRPYTHIKGWAVGIWMKWKIIAAAAVVNLVTTNGIEATMDDAPWAWLREAFSGSGISWRP